MFKKYQAKTRFFISGHSNLTIAKAIIIPIASIDRTHNVLFINEYIVTLLCNLKLVRAFLGEQR